MSMLLQLNNQKITYGYGVQESTYLLTYNHVIVQIITMAGCLWLDDYLFIESLVYFRIWGYMEERLYLLVMVACFPHCNLVFSDGVTV